jgi:hypothetical protein
VEGSLMAHQFDTGLVRPQRTVIQRGAVDLLAGLRRPAGYLITVIPWGSVVRSYTDEDGIAELISALARTPSIAVATGDANSNRAGIGGYQAKKVIDVLLYIATGHRRDNQVGRQEIDVVGAADDHADPGLHIIMEHTEELLIGQRCGMASSIKQIELDREEELATTSAATIWLQTFRVEVRRNISEFRNATQLLESIRWRTAIDPNEVNRPAPATDPASIDVDSDNLDPGT